MGLGIKIRRDDWSVALDEQTGEVHVIQPGELVKGTVFQLGPPDPKLLAEISSGFFELGRRMHVVGTALEKQDFEVARRQAERAEESMNGVQARDAMLKAELAAKALRGWSGLVDLETGEEIAFDAALIKHLPFEVLAALGNFSWERANPMLTTRLAAARSGSTPAGSSSSGTDTKDPGPVENALANASTPASA